MLNELQVISIEPRVADARRLRKCLSNLAEYNVRFSLAPSLIDLLPHEEGGAEQLLMVDYDLPTITGLEMIDLARSAGEQRPIIATAAEDCSYLAADLIRAGADGYLAKRDMTSAFVGGLISAALQRARQRTMQVRIQHQTTREVLRSPSRRLELV